ncbi:glycoside hydrolase family 19 protein [Sulfitobacter sp. 1A15106]|uniref:glycoside hydrolase family 19 protein n=1 Tax=Sulfitobacter sp. 1A15106 TaxID=3368590 RepID=UPI0037467B86
MFGWLRPKRRPARLRAPVDAELVRKALSVVPDAKPHVRNAIIDHTDVLIEGGVDTPLRLAHFLAQAAVETAHFRTFREYGGTAYFNRMYGPQGGRKHVAKMLGNTQPGDGAKYRGRGIFQTTGRYNTTALARAMGVDFVSKPQLLETPEWAVKSAVFYWQDRKLGVIADQGATGAVVKKITKRVNGGYNHLTERKAYFVRFAEALELGQTTGKPITRSKTAGAALGLGSLGGLGAVSEARYALEDGKGIADLFGIDPMQALMIAAIVGLTGFIIYDRWRKSHEELV